MLTLLLALAFVQGPLKPAKHPELGLEFPRSADYDPIPTQPTEREIVLYFAERRGGSKRASSRFEEDPGRAVLAVLWLEPAGPATANTGKESEPASHATLAQWVKDRMPGWKLRAYNDWPDKKGWVSQEYQLTPNGGDGGSVQGWAWTWIGADRTIAFIGIAPNDDFNRQRESWMRTAQSCSITEPREPSMADVERRYARTTLREIPERIEVRRRLLRGWSAEDTDDYLVVHHTQDLAMVRRVMTNIQIIRTEYARLFPPTKPITAVGVVRICRDRDEYLAYGGPEGSAGYWNPATRELVLYDAEKDPGNQGKGDAPTFLALYHEAFHQFVHYAAGELAPHSWFGEGWGDYFSGARVQGGKLVSVGPHPWRVDLVKEAVTKDMTVPLDKLLRLEQAEFYDPSVVSVCYAQAWSFIWFLRRSEIVAANAAWSGILDRYYSALREAWSAEVTKLGAAPSGSDPAPRDAAEQKSRKIALEAALVGVDVSALESAWKDFVRTGK